MPVDPAVLERLWLGGRVRLKQWQRIHPGVYAVFTGPLPWRSRTWAAVLYAGEGAALGFEAAGHDAGLLPRPPGMVDVLVPGQRRVRDRPGLRQALAACRAGDTLVVTKLDAPLNQIDGQ